MQEKKIRSLMKAGCITLGLAAGLIRLTAGGVAIACVYSFMKKDVKRRDVMLQRDGFSNRV